MLFYIYFALNLGKSIPFSKTQIKKKVYMIIQSSISLSSSVIGVWIIMCTSWNGDINNIDTFWRRKNPDGRIGSFGQKNKLNIYLLVIIIM